MRVLRGSSRFGRIALAVVMLAAGIGIGMGAMTAAQEDGTVYYACVNNDSGAIKMTDASSSCSKNEHPISWNQQGPAGQDGADGADGTNGVDGANGSNGLNCWDLDGDGAFSLGTEDTNGDGSATALDCQGPAGDQGVAGQDGDDGEDGTFSGMFSSPNSQYSISVTDAGIVLRNQAGQRIELTGSSIVINGHAVTIQSSTTTRVNGGQVLLNGGCAPVARRGDRANGFVPDGGGTITSTIIDGSLGVRAC